MRVAIVGSRGCPRLGLVRACVRRLPDFIGYTREIHRPLTHHVSGLASDSQVYL